MSQTEVQLIKADAVQTADIANSAVTDAKISALTSSKLTGALPAISGASLTNLPASGKAHNLVINGAMQVAQRGTSSTANGYGSVDRFTIFYTGTDEAPTQEQADVASGTTPYTLGFRKSLKITNGNQTSGAGAADYMIIRTVLEAQDIANSGWNYLSASSNITLSFWVKSSVAQNFYGNLWTQDGTQYNYVFETGSLSADTWTKVTKTVSGNSNLTFNNDNGAGLRVQLVPFEGTNYTGTRPLNAWAAFDGNTIQPDNTSTWYTTNDATLEITGLQLEVGDSATDFEHRSFAQELALCQRYYQKTYKYETAPGTGTTNGAVVHTMYGSLNYAGFALEFVRPMRTTPTITFYSSNNGNTGKSSADSGDGNAIVLYGSEKRVFQCRSNDNNGTGANVFLRCQYQADAEL